MNMGDMKEKLKKVGNSLFLETFYRIILSKDSKFTKEVGQV